MQDGGRSVAFQSTHHVSQPPTGEWRLALARSAPTLVIEIFLKVLILASLGVFLVSVFWGPTRTGALAGMNLLVDLLLFYRVRRGDTRGVAFALALSLWALSSYACWRGYGTHDVGMVVLGLLMMVVALLRPRWQAGLLVGLALAVVWAMGWAEIHGRSRHLLAQVTDYDDIVILSILFVASAAIMRVVVARLSQSLATAHASDRNYKEIFNATHDALFVLNADTGAVLHANAAAKRLVGGSVPNLAGVVFCEVIAAAKDDLTQWLEECRRGAAVTSDRLLTQHERPALWVEMSLRPATIDGQPRILASLRDVHARHRLEEELRQADKLRALGHLAGGVAHDFNNQLTGILASAELLRLEGQRNRPMNPAFVEAIIKCALRSAELTKQLLAFARKARPRREEVDVAALVNDVVNLLQRGLDPHIKVLADPPSQPMLAAADPSLLHSALLNLGINAKESMTGGGELRFALNLVDLPATRAEPLELSPGPYLEIQVRDTGTGMDAATKAQIFDPFFTTKETVTGMGLAAAYGTVRGHGGALTVQSELGKGSTFFVYLPPAPPATQSKSESRLPALVPSQQNLMVWVVDDEPEVALTTLHMLQALGHQTRVFCSSKEASAAFLIDPSGMALCVLDRVMPDQSGDQLLGCFRAQRPALPAVLVSGYSQEQGPAGHPQTILLQKPFGPADLQAAIEQLMPEQLADR